MKCSIPRYPFLFIKLLKFNSLTHPPTPTQTTSLQHPLHVHELAPDTHVWPHHGAKVPDVPRHIPVIPVDPPTRLPVQVLVHPRVEVRVSKLVEDSPNLVTLASELAALDLEIELGGLPRRGGGDVVSAKDGVGDAVVGGDGGGTVGS